MGSWKKHAGYWLRSAGAQGPLSEAEKTLLKIEHRMGQPTLCGRWGRVAAKASVDCAKCLAALETQRRLEAQRRLAERLVRKAKRRLPGLADIACRPELEHYYNWVDWVGKAQKLLIKPDYSPERVEAWLVGEFHRALQLHRDCQVIRVQRALESSK